MKFNQELENAFVHENNFYLTCDNSRIGKFIAHYELFKKVKDIEGAVVECGVFKGISLIRFATFRKLIGNEEKQPIYGFDIFGEFPETDFQEDKELRSRFIAVAGSASVSEEELLSLLVKKDLAQNVSLIEGDICKTVPDFFQQNKNLKISLLNIDVDIYEPAVVILQYLYPMVLKGGVILLDDYKKFPGETKAVDDYFRDKNVTIEKFPYADYPYFIIKNED
jgi:hypothetical protein